MSLLAPLYFIGALAVGLPILFHLIRRQPKGQVEFSSLMFLRPTPPRLTRRSRLDNWFLLLLRALALTLLAAAFARPFLRSVAQSDTDVPGRRIVLMVDTSASMQRTGLWQQALDEASTVLADLQPADTLALVTFDSQPKLAVSFEQSTRSDVDQMRSTAQKALRNARPSWQSTDLGRAISFAGDLAVTYEVESGDDEAEIGVNAPATVASNRSGPAHLILITDMQSGSQIESLQVYAWPKELRLDVRKVTPQRRTNASAQILAPSAEDGEDPDKVRVRVFNVADAESGNFSLAWTASSQSVPQENDAQTKTGPLEKVGSRDDVPNHVVSELPIQVPPGETRMVRMPIAPPGVDSLVLKGDAHTFDNTRYVVSPEPVQMSMQYIGEDSADPRDSLLYYLQRVPLHNVRRSVAVEPVEPEAIQTAPNPKQVPLVVLARQVDGDVLQMLRQYVETGGRLLAVLPNQEVSDGILHSVNAIASTELHATEANVDDYVMLSRIDFAHPVFEPMADPQFNDFSKIRFWTHRKIENLDPKWQVVATFDDGDPALIEATMGEGRLLVLATGWQPRSGQLALSTKFIPLIYSLFDLGRRAAQSDQYIVGEAIDYPPSPTATIRGPAGIEFPYNAAADLEGIDQPGVYMFRDGEEIHSFAVNLAETESHTEAIGEDELERFGVILGKNATTQQAIDAQRQLRDQELESQQKLWQWLLVAALGILGLETILGGLWSRREPSDSFAVTAGQ